MKLCIDCRWHENGFCKSPQKVKKSVSPVTGKTEMFRAGLDLKLCESNRTGMLTGWIGCRLHNLCGKEARWFTPKEETK